MLIKVNGAEIPINGKRVYVKIIRDSYLCRWFKKDMLIVGNRIHYLKSRLRGVDIRAGLEEVKTLHRIGVIQYYWNLLTTTEN